VAGNAILGRRLLTRYDVLVRTGNGTVRALVVLATAPQYN
jgi:hypothetical protein